MRQRYFYTTTIGIGFLWDVMFTIFLPRFAPFYAVLTLMTIIYYAGLMIYCYYQQSQLGQLLMFLLTVIHIVYFIYLFSFVFAL